MNSRYTFIRWGFSYLLTSLCILPAYTQLTLWTDQPDAVYHVGDTILFQAQSDISGPANYELFFDSRAPVAKTGTLELRDNQVFSIPYVLNEPGVIILKLNQNGYIGRSPLPSLLLKFVPEKKNRLILMLFGVYNET